jgi:hypothetical protein
MIHIILVVASASLAFWIFAAAREATLLGSQKIPNPKHFDSWGKKITPYC